MGDYDEGYIVDQLLGQIPAQSTGAHDGGHIAAGIRDVGTMTVNDLVRRWSDMPSHVRKQLTADKKETLRAKLTREAAELEVAIVALAAQRAHREAQLEKLKMFPEEDPFGDGTFLTFEKNFPSNPDQKYTYMATRAGGLWYVTGKKTPQGVTWEHFVNWMGLGVDEIFRIDQNNGRVKVIG